MELDEYIRRAARIIGDAKDAVSAIPAQSRELSLVATKLDEARLWLSQHGTQASS